MKETSRSIDRRALLAGGLGLGGLVWLGGHGEARIRIFGERDGDAGQATAQRTLLLVQLTGGNDALSMVVPYGDDAYGRARTSTRHDAKSVLKLDGYRGLHANLAGLKSMWDEGHLALVEGCGYPNPIRSHFKSYEVWHTASDKGRSLGTGWIGKLVAKAWPDDATPELVVHVGSAAPYSVYSTQHPPLVFQTPASYRWVGPESEDMEAYRRAAEMDQKELDERKNGGRDKALERLRGVLSDANASSARVRKAAAAYKPRAKYPDDEFGEALRVVASLLDARLGSRVLSVELGGFDTHNNQKNAHDNLMKRLDDGLSAFFADVRGTSAGQDVVAVVFSEFGRRVQENGSRGTDHGVAAPMLVMGAKIDGGLYGKHPSLEALDDGDLVHTTDFRSVYGTLIDKWMGADHASVLGARYPTLRFLA